MISKFIDDVTSQIMTGLEFDKRGDDIKYKLEQHIVRRILQRNLDGLLKELELSKEVTNDVQGTQTEIPHVSR
jgi:hypothetical protein